MQYYTLYFNLCNLKLLIYENWLMLAILYRGSFQVLNVYFETWKIVVLFISWFATKPQRQKVNIDKFGKISPFVDTIFLSWVVTVCVSFNSIISDNYVHRQ